MRIAAGLLFVLGWLPLLRACSCNRRASLFHALLWCMPAWASWGLVVLGGSVGHGGWPPYLALCLTAAAGVAVLGARRPHVGAWNFVVLGFVAVMTLPLAQMFLPWASMHALYCYFLGATLAAVVLNYVPTRFAPAAVVLLSGLSAELTHLVFPEHLGNTWTWVGRFALLSVPWLAWLSNRYRRRPASELDRLWLDFRDRFGALWAQRVREQFNHACRNAGWPVVLAWTGLNSNAELAPDALAAMTEALRSLLKRFENA